MHPAVIDCHASSPVAALWWYDGPVVSLAGLLEVEAGVAAHTFAAVLDGLAAEVQQQQAVPRKLPCTVPKVFGPAMRQGRVEQHISRDPSRCGADIFAHPMGECAACAGRDLPAAAAAAPHPSPPQPPATMAALAPHDSSQVATAVGPGYAAVHPAVAAHASLALPVALQPAHGSCSFTEEPDAVAGILQLAAAGDAEVLGAAGGAAERAAAEGAGQQAGAAVGLMPGLSWSLLPLVSGFQRRVVLAVLSTTSASAAYTPCASLVRMPTYFCTCGCAQPSFLASSILVVCYFSNKDFTTWLFLQANAQPVTTNWELKPGVTAEQRLLSLNADANAKLNHYRHSGQTITEAYSAAGVEPPIKIYFDKGEQVLEGMQDSQSGPAGAPEPTGQRRTSCLHTCIVCT